MYQYAFFIYGRKIIITVDSNKTNNPDLESVAKKILWHYIQDFRSTNILDIPDAHSMSEVVDGHIWDIELED